jgi:hypothetical protein
MYPITLRVPRLEDSARSLALFCVLAWTAGGPALAGTPVAVSTDVTVVAVQGEVSVATQGVTHSVHRGDVLSLPAIIDTGPNGSIELAQAKTTVSVAPNTELTLPAPLVAGELIDHVVQARGNAFYSVAKRVVRKLHVETPYLVAVIKGTQFSVVAENDSTTISLFEGRLEVDAPDMSDSVDLEAGEIAIRHAGDAHIRMLHMDSGEPVARNGAAGPLPADTGADLSLRGGAIAPLSGAPGGLATLAGTDTHGTGAVLPISGTAPLPSPMSAEAGVSAGGTSLSAGASLGSNGATLTTGLTTQVAGLSAGTSVNLGASPAGVNLGTSVSASAGSANVAGGLNASVGTSGVSAGAATSVSTPLASAGTSLTAAATPGGLTGTSVTSVSTPVLSASTGLGASAGTGGTSLGASTSVSTPVSATPVSVSTQLSTSSLGLTVSTPVTAVTLGSTTSPTTTTTTTTGSGSTGTPTTTNPVGTLLGTTTNPIKTLLGH